MAIKAGALGGKLLGAGGGGFLLFYCEKDKQENLIKALEQLMIVPFNFENDGAQVCCIMHLKAIHQEKRFF